MIAYDYKQIKINNLHMINKNNNNFYNYKGLNFWLK